MHAFHHHLLLWTICAIIIAGIGWHFMLAWTIRRFKMSTGVHVMAWVLFGILVYVVVKLAV
jgi:NhaP-type Na+/H+ and K+/H+ antiporter